MPTPKRDAYVIASGATLYAGCFPPSQVLPSLSLSGPGSGTVGSATSVFTVTLSNAAGGVVFTPTSTGGGTFSPASVTLTENSPTATFTHTPASASTYNIGGTNDQGVTGPSALVFAASPAIPAAPVAGFTAVPLSGTVPLTVTVTSTATGTGLSYDMDWGDGSAHSTTQHPSHAYTSAGVRTLRQVVTDSYGRTDTLTRTGYVTATDPAGPPSPPTPGLTLANLAVKAGAAGTGLPYSATALPLRGVLPAGYTFESPDDAYCRASILSTHDDGSAAVVVVSGRTTVTLNQAKVLRLQGVAVPALVAISAPSSVAVPADFLGMHLHKYPVDPNGGAADPAPTFTYGSYRSIDSGLSWRQAHTGAGTFDWGLHDTILGYHVSANHSLTYTLYQTPTHLVQPAFAAVPDAYGAMGGTSPPSDVAQAAAFVTALVTRFPIARLELWNEPGSGGFWGGTAAEFAAMAAPVVAAARSARPSIEIMSPGFSSGSDIAPYLAAVDTVSGQKLAAMIDSIALHPYGQYPHGTGSFVDGILGAPTMAAAAAACSLAGVSSKPVHISEWGMASVEAYTAPFARWSAANRRERIGRMLLMAAIQGVKSFGVYSFGSSLCGDLINDSAGVIAELIRFQAAIPGKTLTLPKFNPATGAVSCLANGVAYSA